MVTIEGVARVAARRCSGVWHYLTARVQGRRAVELERMRNEATMVVLSLLKPGTDFYESEAGGRTRLIRLAQPSAGPAAVGPSQPATDRIDR